MRNKVSLRHYIFTTILGSLLGFGIILLLFNMFISNRFKEEFIFHELEESAEYKKEHRNDTSDDFPIAHFLVEFTSENYIIHADNYTKKIYGNPQNNFYIEIVDEYLKADTNKGSFKNLNDSVYYYTESYGDNRTMFFMTTHRREKLFNSGFILILIIFTIIIFFSANKIAKYISEPIISLKAYSVEISKKNYQATLDPIDNVELEELGTYLINMKNELEQIDQNERYFLQTTSHDLKTPIMVIKGYAQSMIDGIKINSMDKPEKIILNEAERLERKVTQLIHLNTLQHASEQVNKYEVVRVDRILKNIVSKLRVIRPELQFDLENDVFECQGNSDTLLIAFENIVENQIRYANKKITITMDNDCIYISNDGPGFDTNPETLFDIYHKGKEGQFGLGLSISERVFNAHNGEIKAYNTQAGVCFEIKLPRI
ncbi:MAG: HAMP domain-containing histidine kinase [Clostridiales bacterium]|nr:HAMP domain-containing histidine kinase [Clostridiales bacterium]